MEPHDAIANQKTAPQTRLENVSKAKGAVDLDLVLLCFYDEFANDPVAASERLFDLLLDPVTCEARIVVLKEMARSELRERSQPGGWLSPPHSYVRELLWLANGQLRQAIETERACLEYVCQLAANPDLLRWAHDTVMHGNEVLAKMVTEHQAAAWSWLRQQVCTGKLPKEFGGRCVAVWRADQPYREFEVGDSERQVRAAAGQRWLVPEELLAVTYVDQE